MNIDIIDGKTVQSCLPISECIKVINKTFQALYAQQTKLPQRLCTPLFNSANQLLTMPGALADPAVVGVKTLTLYPSNPERSLPAIQGFITLFDSDTGSPIALIDAASITAIRTAAASAAATQILAREEASTLTLIGTGIQAETHLEAILAIRPLKQVLIWGRNPDKAKALVERMRCKHTIAIETIDNLQAAVSTADIICTLTASKQPLIQGQWLKPGAHLNLVGSHTPDAREVDTNTIKRSRLYVEIKSTALSEAGDILIPLNNKDIDESHIIGEIGGVITGDIQGRQSPDQITLYKSLGNAAQDLAAANAVYVDACKKGKTQKILL